MQKSRPAIVKIKAAKYVFEQDKQGVLRKDSLNAAMKKFEVHETGVREAIRILNHAIPEVVTAACEDKISFHLAYRLARDHTPANQKKILLANLSGLSTRRATMFNADTSPVVVVDINTFNELRACVKQINVYCNERFFSVVSAKKHAIRINEILNDIINHPVNANVTQTEDTCKP